MSYHCQDVYPDQTPIPFPPVVEVDRFLAISTPPPSPLTPYLSPLPQIQSPPPPGYRVAIIRLRAESPSTSHLLPPPPPIVLSHTRASIAIMRAVTPSTYILASRSETPPSGTPPHLPIPLPTSSPHLLLPSTVCRAGVSEVTLPPQKRLCIALGLRFEVGESSSAPTARPTGGFRANYGFVGTLDDEIRRDPKRERMTDFVTTVKHDTDEIYGRLDDAQDDRSLMSGQLNMLRRDRRAHARTTRVMETEARLSPQKTKIRELRAADRMRQTYLTEALTLLRTLQTHMAVIQSQQTSVRDPAQPDVPEEAGSSS
ncbi:hypothetical protein Tco_0077378 [Tanacetum coccineum]